VKSGGLVNGILRGKTWWLDFTHSGRRHQVRLGRSISRTVAKELAAVERAKALKGEAGIGARKRKDISFEKAQDEFLAWAKANKKPRTAGFYRDCLQALGKSFYGRKLSEIHPFLIEKHKQARIANGFRVVANRDLATLSVLFNRSKEWKQFDGDNPVRSVGRLDEPKNRLRYLTEQEESSLLGECDEPLRTIVLVGIYAGLRIKAEAFTLKKENVDLARRLLTIEAAYSKNGETQTIPIHSRLVEPLRARMLESASESVFCRKDGEAGRSIRTAFENACKRTGLKDVTLHTLRHTFASRLAMSGAGNKTLKELGRWKTAGMIDRYAHLSQEHLAQALEKIGVGSENSTTLVTTPGILKTASGS
jgi:integrase